MATKYSKGAQDKVKKAMHERKHGTLKSGGSGKTVISKKQAIAIGLSEAREEGKKVRRRKRRLRNQQRKKVPWQKKQRQKRQLPKRAHLPKKVPRLKKRPQKRTLPLKKLPPKNSRP